MTSKNITLLLAAILIIGGIAYWHYGTKTAAPSAGAPVSGTYTDKAFGFSFTYPVGTTVTETALSDTNEFPGAIAVKSIQIGEAGGVTVFEIVSPNGVITDEPDGHASPIAQTKYFYDATAKLWMVAYPEGKDNGSSSASTTAPIAGQTSTGLTMFPSGRRFDTRIIPLFPTKFIVVTSGGGIGSADIAKSVALAPQS